MGSMPRTTKTTKQTAAACYAERHAECQDLLKRIASRLEQHKRIRRRNPPTGGTPATSAASPRNSPTSSPAWATAARWMPKDWSTDHAEAKRKIGTTYIVKVSGTLAKVRLTREHPRGGW